MSKKIKNIAITINLLILIFSILWIKKTNFDYEPITVCLGQLLSLIVIIFGEAMQSRFSVKSVSNSKVKIDTQSNDNSEYDIENIEDNSEVNITKR